MSKGAKKQKAGDKTQKVVIDGAEVSVKPDKVYSNGKTGKQIIDENSNSATETLKAVIDKKEKTVKPKEEKAKPVVKKVISITEVLEALKDKPLLCKVDSGGYVAFQLYGKIINYVKDSRKGITISRKNGDGNWVSLPSTTKEELKAFIAEITETINNTETKTTGDYVPIVDFLKSVE